MADDPQVAGNLPADGGSAPQDNPEPQVQGDWRASLPVELRKEKSLEAIKDVGSLAKGYVESQRLVGGSIRLPNDKMKPEEQQKAWEDVYKKMGRPEKPEGYEVAVKDDYKKWIPESDVSAWKTTAHKLGLTPKQTQGAIDHFQNMIGANVTNMTEQRKKVEADLRQEWGDNFDRNVGLAARAVIESGGKDLLTFLDQSGLGNHPALIKAFQKIGSILAQEGYMKGEIDGVEGPKEAKEEINAILSDKAHPYWVAGSPDHKEAVENMARLHQIAYPEG